MYVHKNVPKVKYIFFDFLTFFMYVCHVVPVPRIFLYLYISLNQGTSHATPDQPSAQVQVIGPSGIDDSAQAPPLRHGSVLAF